jgi:hypothetical protein
MQNSPMPSPQDTAGWDALLEDWALLITLCELPEDPTPEDIEAGDTPDGWAAMADAPSPSWRH